MANVISYPLYYTSYYTTSSDIISSSGIVNLTGFIFHAINKSDDYYFPLPPIFELAQLVYPPIDNDDYYFPLPPMPEIIQLPLTFELVQVVYLPIDTSVKCTTECAKSLGLYYSTGVERVIETLPCDISYCSDFYQGDYSRPSVSGLDFNIEKVYYLPVDRLAESGINVLSLGLYYCTDVRRVIETLPCDISYCSDFYQGDYSRPSVSGLDFNTERVYYLPIDDLTKSGINVLSLGLHYCYTNLYHVNIIKSTPLNIGKNVLNIHHSNSYLLICTDLGIECLDDKTFKSKWYFNSNIVCSTCYNYDKNIICFGTISSGIYYNYFPTISNNLGDNFLGSCERVDNLTSNKITSICMTFDGFFVGGNGGVDVLTVGSGLELKVDCQLTCSGVNSVAYSYDTSTYYWSTASKVYCANIHVES